MLRAVLVPFVVTRAILLAVAALAFATLPVIDRCRACEIASIPWLNAFVRWDGTAYIAIADQGYRTVHDYAFFPLYPAMIRVVGTVLGGSVDALVIAGILIANASAIAALWYVARIARDLGGDRLAERSTLALLAFPTSFFLSVVYSESLLLLGLAGCLFHARNAQWKRAALFGAVAALARPFGVLAFVPLVLEARHHGRRALAAATVPIATTAGWLIVGGGPRTFLDAQARYGRHPALALSAFTDLFDPAIYGDPWIVLATTVFVGGLTVALWRTLPLPLCGLATAYVLGAVSTGTLTSAPRYYLASIPVFIYLAIAAGRVTRTIYLVIGIALGALLAATFMLGYWVA